MKCDYCDSKATVFLTQLAEGQMKKVCLCDSCAKERGVTDPTGFSLADMLLGKFEKATTGAPTPAQGKVGGRREDLPGMRFHHRRPAQGAEVRLRELL